MGVHVRYIEEAKALYFSISYSSVLGSNDPEAIAQSNLLKNNIAALGLEVVPKLTISTFNPKSDVRTSCTWRSSNLCYLVKTDNFYSIKDIERVLQGFKEHNSHTLFLHPKFMEYAFESNSKQKLTNLFITKQEASIREAMSNPYCLC
jgi:hypothetical protein